MNRDNVSQLRVAWTYDTHDAFPRSEMECTPLVAEGVLYATTPRLRVVALDAATGKRRWQFDPFNGKTPPGKFRNRGLTYWREGAEVRLFFAAREYLYALDARTGLPVAGFGEAGRVSLRDGFDRDVRGQSISITSPGVVYKDLLITGSIVPESLPALPGDIRAYDVRTGKIRWTFHTIPHPGEFGYETWPPDAWKYIGAANNWSGMTLDAVRGLVFVPTGSASFDFYGANRLGDNLFANTLLALKADTGERVWHFQTVRHDLWDRDLPAPPTLVQIERDGRKVDAVAQITKSGYVFLFDRDTGRPLYPIEYRDAPTEAADGEMVAKSQPFPTVPPPFARQLFDEALATDRTPKAHDAVVERLRTLRSAGQFVPPSTQGSVIFPGFDGGGEWGGGTWDPETGLFYVNANEMAWVLKLVPQKGPPKSGRALYEKYCAGCHRKDLKGAPPEFPSLAKLRKHLPEAAVQQLIATGTGRMPGLPNLPHEAAQAILDYVYSGKDTELADLILPPSPIDLKYRIDGYNKFLDPDGYPAVKPPWGTLTAMDLAKGTIVWSIPFGEYPELARKGLKNTGTENYGGALAIGGLLFIGATNFDKKFHAFDAATGRLLWEATLPAAGNATPVTYEVSGRQYIVIAAGGGKSAGAKSGGKYIAFALPK
jgi:quinoprotein glucose dehydrogenase